MAKTLMLVGSVTYAMKAKNLLNTSGFSAGFMRAPKHDSNSGCGYGVFVDKNIKEAEKLLNKNNIKILGKVEVE